MPYPGDFSQSASASDKVTDEEKALEATAWDVDRPEHILFCATSLVLTSFKSEICRKVDVHVFSM